MNGDLYRASWRLRCTHKLGVHKARQYRAANAAQEWS